MDQGLTTERFQTKRQEMPDRPGMFTLIVQGTITYHDAPEFREVLLAEVSNKGVSALIVELGGVERIDTAGLAVLVEALLAGKKRNLRILLCQPSQSVLQLFRMAKLNDVLEASCTTPGEVKQRLMS